MSEMTLEQVRDRCIARIGDVACDGSLSGAAASDIREIFEAHLAQPAQAVDVDTAMESWHSAHCDISDIERNSPDERFSRRAQNVRQWIERNRPDRALSGEKAGPVGDDLSNIGRLIATQDNRITADPIFIVQQKRESVGHPDYDNSRIVWVNDDNGEAGADEATKLEAAFQEDGDAEPDGWCRLAVCEHWEFVTACFTEQGCKDYLARNGHNLREPRIYASGSYRNEEWRRVRSFLLSLATLPAQDKEG